jgi:tripartite-type tricarboxylate transporter receptor subunit TctC
MTDVTDTGNPQALADLVAGQVVARLSTTIGEILRSPEYRAKAGPSTELAPGTPQQLEAFVAAEIDTWKRVVAQAKIEVE